MGSPAYMRDLRLNQPFMTPREFDEGLLNCIVAWNREHTALDELLQLEYEAEDSRHGGIGETWDAFRTRRIAELVEVKP